MELIALKDEIEQLAYTLKRLLDTDIIVVDKLPLGEMKNCFPDKRHGYGVVNILTRLRLKYGDGAAFYCRAQEDGPTCTIKIPRGDGQEAYEQEQIQI